jgi:hypothetical protein
VGQDGILRAGWQPALGVLFAGSQQPTCPTRLDHNRTVRDVVVL